MKEKLWPVIARMLHANKRSISNLYGYLNGKICENFVTELIIQNTNEISIKAAAALWRSLKQNDMKMREEWNRADIQSYNNLMEKLTSLLKNDTL
jgi:hypothetical protein